MEDLVQMDYQDAEDSRMHRVLTGELELREAVGKVRWESLQGWLVGIRHGWMGLGPIHV